MTGLEPAASGVTGRRSNQLSYTPSVRPCFIEEVVACQSRLIALFTNIFQTCIQKGKCLKTGHNPSYKTTMNFKAYGIGVWFFLEKVQRRMAGVTGLEPAASGVTGRRSNQLSYTPSVRPCFIEAAPNCQAT